MRYTIEDINSKKPILSRLTAIDLGDYYYFPSIQNGKQRRERRVICKCLCGTIGEYFISPIVRGKVISCGCYNSERTAARNRANRKYETPPPPKKNDLYTVYKNMMYRCYKPYLKAYKNYGAKGVVVCDEWRGNWPAFREWALANGYKKGLELDKDIKGTGYLYSPEMCCFVTRKENLGRKRSSKRYAYDGEELTIPQIAERVNLPSKLIRLRLKRMSLEAAIRSQ